MMLNACSECRNQVYYAEWPYADCHYCECHYAECRGAFRQY